MRKYDKVNKRNIFIISIICLIILISFFVFMKRVSNIEKKEYVVDANSVLYDSDKNLLMLEEEGLIKIKWSGSYYLKYRDDSYKLEKTAIVFNNATKFLNLYGTLFKINADESIDVLKDETIVEDTILPKFYKFEDRKYLLVSGNITSVNNSFNAENYLIVELDKMGNATLINNKLNMKTLVPTTLITSDYSFDIANEILTYGDKKIDLKKIIGSTNLYNGHESDKTQSEDSINSEKDNTSNDKPNNQNGTTDNKNDADNDLGSNEVINESSENLNSSNNDQNIEDVVVPIVQDKNLSIIKNQVSTNSLYIDYNLYDPLNEYKSVFVEIENDATKEIETYYLAKNGSSIQINNLTPNTKYNLVYKYSYLNSEKEVIYESFSNLYSLTTLMPDISIAIKKISKGILYYQVKSEAKVLTSANIELLVNNIKKVDKSVSSSYETDILNGTIDLNDITDSEELNYLTLYCTSITTKTSSANVNVLIKTKY